MKEPKTKSLSLLLECAESYLIGKSNFAALNGYAQNLKDDSLDSDENPKLVLLANEWIININRAWNEWGLEKNPLSEKEFKRWLSNQISSFK